MPYQILRSSYTGNIFLISIVNPSRDNRVLQARYSNTYYLERRYHNYTDWQTYRFKNINETLANKIKKQQQLN